MTKIYDLTKMTEKLPTIMGAKKECEILQILMKIPNFEILTNLKNVISIIECVDTSRNSSFFEYRPETNYFKISHAFSKWLTEIANNTTEKNLSIELKDLADSFSLSFNEADWLNEESTLHEKYDIKK